MQAHVTHFSVRCYEWGFIYICAYICAEACPHMTIQLDPLFSKLMYG
jgi:hypothetical protein